MPRHFLSILTTLLIIGLTTLLWKRQAVLRWKWSLHTKSAKTQGASLANVANAVIEKKVLPFMKMAEVRSLSTTDRHHKEIVDNYLHDIAMSRWGEAIEATGATVNEFTKRFPLQQMKRLDGKYLSSRYTHDWEFPPQTTLCMDVVETTLRPLYERTRQLELQVLLKDGKILGCHVTDSTHTRYTTNPGWSNGCKEILKAAYLGQEFIIGAGNWRFMTKTAPLFIAENMTLKTSKLGKEALINAAKTSMSSKIIGKDNELFAKIAVDAMLSVETKNSQNKKRYPVKAVEIIKVTGKGMRDVELINGYCLHEFRCSQQMPRSIKNAKIAMVDFDMRRMALKFGVQMIMDDPTQVEAMRAREYDIIRERIDLLIKAGANVILTTKGIDDAAIKYFVGANCIAVRRVDRKKMKRIAKLTGGKFLVSLADEDGGESVPANALGTAEIVEEMTVGDRDILFIKGCSSTKAQTIVLRGVNWYMLEELERSIHDSLCVIKRVLESGRVVPGGGAVEAALSVYLEHIAEQMSSREQLAIAEFAAALLVIPKTLAINGGYDAADLVSRLRGYHAQSQLKSDEDTKDMKYYGLDLDDGKIANRVNSGVLEPAMSKIKSIKFATEAAITILRIDDSITLAKKENPRGPDGRE